MMVFRVKDREWLERMREGDRIRFTAARAAGTITLTGFEPAR